MGVLLDGFTMAAWVVNFTGAQNILYWAALIATVFVAVELIRVAAKITADVVQKEDPEYIERVVRDIMDDLPTVSPISFVAVFGKTTVAMLEVTAVFGK